jgi:MoaA/NifB/PqqE/SkfB family radical SAM enzyme
MYSLKPKLHERQKAHQPGALRTVALDVTNRCNLHCDHCYAETFRNTQPISLEVLGHALEELHAMGVYHYVLQGGEPLADLQRLKAILKMIPVDESYINIVTNGWLLTQALIEEMKGIGVDKFAFSMDSGIEKEHDARRGQGSLKRVMESIDQVLDAGLLASISTVVTHQSLYSEGFSTAYRYALHKQVRIDVQIAEPVGNWDGRSDVLITPRDAEYIKNLQRISGKLPNGQNVVNRDIYCPPNDHCPAGREFIGITIDGQVMPCNFLQFSAGKIGKHSVKELRDNILKHSWFNGRWDHCILGQNEAFMQWNVLPNINKPKPLPLDLLK